MLKRKAGALFTIDITLNCYRLEYDPFQNSIYNELLIDKLASKLLAYDVPIIIPYDPLGVYNYSIISNYFVSSVYDYSLYINFYLIYRKYNLFL